MFPAGLQTLLIPESAVEAYELRFSLWIAPYKKLVVWD